MARGRNKAFPGDHVLEKGVQRLASLLDECYGDVAWTHKDFFQQVFLSRHNSKIKARKEGKLKEETKERKVELYFIMLRICVCHEDFGLESTTLPADSMSYSADSEISALEAFPLGPSDGGLYGRLGAIRSLVDLIGPIQAAWQDELPRVTAPPAGFVHSTTNHASDGDSLSCGSSGSTVSALQTLPQRFAARGGRLDLPKYRPIRVLVGRPVPGRSLLPRPPNFC
jgi:hypothetical protein